MLYSCLMVHEQIVVNTVLCLDNIQIVGAKLNPWGALIKKCKEHTNSTFSDTNEFVLCIRNGPVYIVVKRIICFPFQILDDPVPLV